jgi:drug/metabolite transporter (DMT)-like permease
MSAAAPAGATHLTAASLFPVLLLALVWGCNWPVLKLGVSDMPPLTFRTLTLPFAALGMMAAARWSGDAIRVPRPLWGKIVVLALFNITFWNAFVLFGLAHLPAGRSAILAYTMPIWGVLFSLVALDEPLAKRKVAGMALGMAGLALLLGEDIRHFQRAPVAALLIVAAAMSWGVGTVLLRKWKLPVAPNALSGWIMLLGAVPIVILAPVMSPGPLSMPSPGGWFAVLYNILLAGTIAHWAWYRLARTLPVVVSSMAALPVPVVGVFSGMLFLGERPGLAEWTALALIMAAMVAVLLPPRQASARGAPVD